MTIEEYKQKYNLKKMGGFGGYPCANTLIYGNSRRCHAMHAAGECLPPENVNDHHSGFKDKKTGEIVMVFQPYFGDLPSDIPRKKTVDGIAASAREWATEKGLSVRVSVEDSWHYPTKTVLVEFRKAAA